MPDWLLNILCQLPSEQQFQVYSELDRRSRLDAAQFTEDILQLEADLRFQRSLDFKLKALTHYTCSMCPEIAPEIYAYQAKAETAYLEGMKSVMNDGFSMAGLL